MYLTVDTDSFFGRCAKRLLFIAVFVLAFSLQAPPGRAETVDRGDEDLEEKQNDTWESDRSKAERSEDGPYRAAETCYALFGNDALHCKNREHRQEVLVKVGGSKGRYYVLHRAKKWDTPIRLRIKGIFFKGIVKDESGDSHVLLRISEEVAETFKCPSGTYRLDRDDSILSDAVVLAVHDDVVLLECNGKLTYMCKGDEASPFFRMIWQSPWEVIQAPDSRGTSRTSSGKSRESKQAQSTSRRRSRKSAGREVRPR